MNKKKTLVKINRPCSKVQLYFFSIVYFNKFRSSVLIAEVLRLTNFSKSLLIYRSCTEIPNEFVVEKVVMVL